MYGMVNHAIEDLVVSSAGREAWEKIKQEAGLGPDEILDSELYDDELTYKLVSAASEVLEQSADSILRAFGRHWILYTGREGWASVFDLGGDNMIDYINGLDSMHARVQMAMSQARMPQFSVVEKETYFELTYRSERIGLAPMVEGLLEGLAEQFEENWEIELLDSNQKKGVHTFSLRKLDSIKQAS